MTKDELFKVMANMRSFYLNAFANQTDEQFLATCKNWYRLFENDDYELMSKALDKYIVTSTTGFAPTPGQLKELMLEVNPLPQKEIGEAWELVIRSARCDYQQAKEQYDKLPSNIQKALGSPFFLRELGFSESEEVKFHRKEFEQKYQMVLKREKDNVASGFLKLEEVKDNNELPCKEKENFKQIGGILKKLGYSD